MDTCDLVDKDTGGDDASVLGEELLQLLLGHGLGQAAHIEVSVTDGGWAGSRIWHLWGKEHSVRAFINKLELCCFITHKNHKQDYSVRGARLLCACVVDGQGCGSLDPQGGKCDCVFWEHLALGIIIVRKRFSCLEHWRDNTSCLPQSLQKEMETLLPRVETTGVLLWKGSSGNQEKRILTLSNT